MWIISISQVNKFLMRDFSPQIYSWHPWQISGMVLHDIQTWKCQGARPAWLHPSCLKHLSRVTHCEPQKGNPDHSRQKPKYKTAKCLKFKYEISWSGRQSSDSQFYKYASSTQLPYKSNWSGSTNMFMYKSPIWVHFMGIGQFGGWEIKNTIMRSTRGLAGGLERKSVDCSVWRTGDYVYCREGGRRSNYQTDCFPQWVPLALYNSKCALHADGRFDWVFVWKF